MKNIITIYFLLFAFTSVFAQEKIYFDENWEVTNKANASYFRMVEKKAENTFLIKDYYLDGTLQMEAVSSKKDKDAFEGEVVWYDKLGNKSTTRQYLHGEAHGKSVHYTPNGTARATGIYKNGNPINGVFEENQDFNNRPAYIRDYNQQRNAYLVYKNGQIISRNFYYKNTDKIAQKEFIIDDGKNQKEWFFYNKKGDQIGHVLFGNTYSWKKKGTMILFYIKDFEMLSVKAKRKYVDDIPKGEEITYKKDGSIWFKGTYKDGEKYDGDFLGDGFHFTYNKGVLTKVVYYDDTYDTVKGEITFKDEEPFNGLAIDGGDEKYYKNGELTRIKTYFNDNQNNIKSDEILLDHGKSEKKWFSKTGKLLGLGLYQYGQILNGLDINIDYTIFTNYKNSKKQGVEKEFSIKNGYLLRKTMYENNHIVWSDVAHPLKKNKILHLSYKNNTPLNGEQFRPYADAFSGFDYKKYQNAILIKHIKYDAKYKDNKGNEEEEEEEEVSIESDAVASKHSNTGKCYKKVYQLTDYDYEPNYLCIKNTTTYDTLGKKLSYTFYRNHKFYTMIYKNGIEYTGTIEYDYSNKLVTYKNGQKIKVLEHFQGWQGKQPQIKYYKNGNIKQTGNSINGYKTGVWKFYFKNGNLKETGQFQDGLKTGEWKIYRKTGSLWETGFYNKGKRNGEWKQYHENGKLSKVSNYKDNLMRRVESYDINGISIKDLKTYKWQSYYADGTIDRNGEYLDEKKHGKWISYNDQGQIDYISIYENGIKKEIKDYYYDGKIKSEAKYKNDKLFWEITYFENGKIKKSLIDSVEKTFYENGQLKRSKKIIHHLAEGKWEYYYNNGQIERIEFYDKDKPIGKWKSYYRNGKKMELVVFNKDSNIGLYKEYYENGNIKTTGNFTNTLQRTGEWKYYDKKGKLTDTETFN